MLQNQLHSYYPTGLVDKMINHLNFHSTPKIQAKSLQAKLELKVE